jgi:hypothetical protein
MQNLRSCFSLRFVMLALAAVWFASGCSKESDQPAGDAKASVPVAAASALPSDEALKTRLDEVLEFTRERQLDPEVNNAWQIVHGLLAFGNELPINDHGKVVPGLEWTLNGGKFRGWDFMPAEKGLDSKLDPGSKAGQGHEDQWLGYLSQVGVPLDHPVVVGSETYHVSDLVAQAQWDVRDRMEATWTLMALSTYLPLDARWKAKDGSEWTIERLAGMEAANDLNESACGGSHRLYGLTTALNRYLAAGNKPSGGWLAVQKKIQESIQNFKANQQPDGAFSTDYLRGPRSSPDIALRINTTGHTLEFLSLALDKEQLSEPWMVRAVVYLCSLLELTRDQPVECGGLYHAAHGLQIYRARRFGAPSPTPETSKGTAKDMAAAVDSKPARN